MTRLRLLFAISVLAALAAGLVACGGGGGGNGEDPDKVLDQTFSEDHPSVKSGDLDIKFNIDVSGEQGGSLDAELSGPFESQGDNKVPKLDFDVSASASGSGQDFSFDGGLTSTGDAAYVNYKGTDYKVTPSLFAQFKQAIEQAAAQQPDNQQSSERFLQLLGVKDAKELLSNLSNDGTADVEGTTTNHISGDLNVNKVVDSLKNLLSNASALGGLGGADTSQLPDASQLDQVKSAIKTAHFDLYSGEDDHILRRLTIDLGIEPPSGSVDKLDLTFDISIGGVNESQTIEAPAGAKPLDDLLRQLGINPSQLDQLGSLGLGAGAPSTGGGGAQTITPPSGGGGANAQQAQKYLNCISKATSAADLQACQALAP